MNRQMTLQGAWQWRRAGEETPHAGHVCGSVLSDMLAEGLIEDPYWQDNEYATRELFTSDYIYEKHFDLSAEDLHADAADLVFEGLDTLADICLNGEAIASTDNMHCRYRFPVKARLRPGDNVLRVTFRSSLNFIRDADAKNDITYASTGCLHGNAALRKAHYMFGWDWGPQLPDAGIYRPVYLQFMSGAKLGDIKHSQHHSAGSVQVDITCICEGALQARHALEVTLTAPDSTETVWVQPCQSGVEVYDIALPISSPQLWWPNGMGEQPLYQLHVRLLNDAVCEDERSLRIGLRTIRLCTSPDAWGSEFAFEVNGHKMFAMGANMIPEDNILSRVTPQRTRRLVADCAAANFNMLRVWGGGYYPEDSLYDACDEYGILVWQDLMFACNVYALDDQGHFEQSITSEVQQQVQRLRHHACMALLCGNNEMEWGWAEWGRLEGHHPRYKRDYLIIFERILARVVAQNDGITPWWASSPSSGGSYYIPSSPDHGDQHYWEVWHSGKPFTEYRKAHFRFCSEYGFQSFPGMKTIRSFTLPEDRNIFSRVMESHQKNGMANSKIFTYVADYFRYPKNMDAISFISQILQLKAIQYGVEFWRQNRGRCMGSLYWQLNDCWPVASWASIDYFGRWKALHYGAKRFYAPVMASACEREELSGQITYYMHNDTLHPQTLTLVVRLVDTAFTTLKTLTCTQTVPPLTAMAVLEADFEPDLADAAQRRRTFATYSLQQDGKEIGRGTTLFVKPKHFALPKVQYAVEVNRIQDHFDIWVRADGFSYYTEVTLAQRDAVFSDNYFDITHAAGVHVTIPASELPADMTAQQLKAQLHVRSVQDTYEAEEA